MKKEKITTYEIKKELMYCKYLSVIEYIIAFLGLVIILIVGINIINIGLGSEIPCELPLILLLYLVYKIPAICNKFNKMEDSFTVRKDTLVSKREARGGGRYSLYKPYRLSFTDGYFDIYKRRHYKWSSLYSMKDMELYDSSYLGDTFTIVEFGIEILLVYNDNFFDVQV